MKNYLMIFPALCLFFFIAGCAGHSVINEPKGLKNSMEQRTDNLESPSPDADIMNEVLLSLNDEESELDYDEARTKLTNFIQNYPTSKWVGCAKALILTIDNLLFLQEKFQAQSSSLDQANKEKEKMVKDYQITEKIYRAEIIRLQQEIELLKKDIAILKRLEIQLDRREKMLR